MTARAAAGAPSSPDDARVEVDGPEAARLTIGLWLLVLVIFLPVMIARHRGSGVAGLLVEGSTVLASMLLGMGIWAVLRASAGLSRPARWGLLCLSILAAAAGQAGYDLLLVRWVARQPALAWPGAAQDLARGYLGVLNDAAVFAVNAGLFQLALARRRGRHQDRQLAALQAARQRAELTALRVRLDPHFLFNTLNGISAMIVTGRPGEADEMVGRLAALLRRALADGTGATPLGEEFEMIGHYAAIERFRFGDRLRVALSASDAAARWPVPPRLVQQLIEPLVEAAGRSDPPATLTVTAEADADRLTIAIAHPELALPAATATQAQARLTGTIGASLRTAPGLTALSLARGEGAV